MIIRRIYFGKDFIRQCKRLPRTIIERAVKKEQVFRKNPLHPSLRLHQLRGAWSGYWSLSITLQYRIIFRRMDNGDILFISIGNHDIYD